GHVLGRVSDVHRGAQAGEAPGCGGFAQIGACDLVAEVEQHLGDAAHAAAADADEMDTLNFVLHARASSMQARATASVASGWPSALAFSAISSRRSRVSPRSRSASRCADNSACGSRMAAPRADRNFAFAVW